MRASKYLSILFFLNCSSVLAIDQIYFCDVQTTNSHWALSTRVLISYDGHSNTAKALKIAPGNDCISEWSCKLHTLNIKKIGNGYKLYGDTSKEWAPHVKESLELNLNLTSMQLDTEGKAFNSATKQNDVSLFSGKCEYIDNIHAAVKINHSGLIRQFVFSGVSLKSRNNEGMTSLHYGAIHSTNETLELLLDLGINVSDTDNKGNTALHYAAIRDDIGAIALLVKGGAEIDSKNKTGQTPLNLSTLYGNIKASRYIKDKYLKTTNDIETLQKGR